MIEFDYYSSVLEKSFNKKLIENGWSNNKNDDRYFNLEKISNPNNQYLFYFLLYLNEISTPVALAFVYPDLEDIDKLYPIYSVIADKLCCPTIIKTDLKEFTVISEYCRYENNADYFNISTLDLSIIYADFVTKKCNSLLTFEQSNFIDEPFIGNLYKFYNTAIQQTCIIIVTTKEGYDNNYSIPKPIQYYQIIDEKGNTIIDTSDQTSVAPYLRHAILLYERLRH